MTKDEVRAMAITDFCTVLAPLLIVICGEAPNPLRLAEKLEALSNGPAARSQELCAGTSVRLATLLANAIRENAGGTLRSNA